MLTHLLDTIIFKSMEQGATFRISMPKYPTKDPHYRILARQRSRFTHYYFYSRVTSSLLFF